MAIAKPAGAVHAPDAGPDRRKSKRGTQGSPCRRSGLRPSLQSGRGAGRIPGGEAPVLGIGDEAQGDDAAGRGADLERQGQCAGCVEEQAEGRIGPAVVATPCTLR
eukprot:Opistho-1_new@31147